MDEFAVADIDAYMAGIGRRPEEYQIARLQVLSTDLLPHTRKLTGGSGQLQIKYTII
jgi:hypothetical protein